MKSRQLAAAACLFFSVASAGALNEANDLLYFYSRPDLAPPKFTIHHQDVESVSPGYYFLSPWGTQQLQSGPYIFDSRGELVWSGLETAAGGPSHGLRVCDYHGANHLCWFEGLSLGSWAKGRGMIVDDHYHVVNSVHSVGSPGINDMHEFQVLPGGTALISVYSPVLRDLTAYNVTRGMGWVLEAGFQEIDIDSGEALFMWHALDHVGLEECAIPAYTKDKFRTWDYFHLNSVAKFDNGDYLISGRHTHTLYRISKDDGHIVWRLGGQYTDFSLENFRLAYQHHARILKETPTSTYISLFNNGFDGWHGGILEHSFGLIIIIDHEGRTARIVQRFEPETLTTLSSSQGNLDFMPNGNVLIGWGDTAFFTEHSQDGTCIFNASLANNNTAVYRVSKSENWKGYPSNQPALWTYARTDDSTLVFYASWNGATEVKSWRFHVSNDPDGPFLPMQPIGKDGFETKHRAHSFYRYSYVEALDEDGNVLDRSKSVKTFVPSAKLAKVCGEDACPTAATDTPPKAPHSNKNQPPKQHPQKPPPKPKIKIDFDTLQQLDNTTTVATGMMDKYSTTQGLAVLITMALIVANIVEAFRTLGRKPKSKAWWSQQRPGPSLEETANFR